MPELQWDQTGKRLFEVGTEKGVLYPTDDQGAYVTGIAWNGLTGVTESPDGGEETPLYADNMKYLSLYSTENFKGTISAYTYPDEFAECDGSVEVAAGVTAGQQTRQMFGMSYQTKIGNDVKGNDLGYKIHLVYAAMVSPSERAYETVNETPSAITFSWSFTTTPPGNTVIGLKPTAHITVDSTKVPAAKLTELEKLLYGDETNEPKLPTIEEVIALVGVTTP